MLKKIVFSTFIAISLFTTSQYIYTNPASAAPNVKLGYYDGAEYIVDKGTLTVGGKIEHPVLKVTVLINKDDILKGITYRFTEQSDGWEYFWEKPGGKSSGSWARVADNKLANDILYVITTH